MNSLFEAPFVDSLDCSIGAVHCCRKQETKDVNRSYAYYSRPEYYCGSISPNKSKDFFPNSYLSLNYPVFGTPAIGTPVIKTLK